MGTQHKDGYSADVEGFLVVAGQRIRLATSNGCSVVLAESCELVPNTVAELLVIVDGSETSRAVTLPSGVRKGQTLVEYDPVKPEVPF